MNLDNYNDFGKFDTLNMLAEIDGLPKQLKTAWKLGQRFPLPNWEGIERVLVAGMGGSAIGASLLEAYAAPLSEVPVFIHRDYDLPAWAKGQETLVIASSHSGNTEETLSAFGAAVEQGCRILAVTTGGKIAAKAKEHGTGLWQFEHKGQPRAAVGY
ncbi:MAG: bifunctional phosphoglucose/phosphomannose isomerase, partial [Chloroflexota bacterium]|nr:bifunctional phosphoglucose/phosphomannose isomerase [Chloroflexota bacterium]